MISWVKATLSILVLCGVWNDQFSVFSEELERDVEFEVVGEAPDKAPPPQHNKEEVNSISNGNKDSAQPSTSSKGEQEETLFINHIDCGANELVSQAFLYLQLNTPDPSNQH